MLTFLHAADFHLDSPFHALPPEQAAERRQVGRCRDDEYVPDAGEHQRRQRVIDHRFVVDREQLFADPLGYRIEARSRASRQDNAFHIVAC